MTKAQYRKAWEKDQQRKQASRAERLVMIDYPGDHNPYILHAPTSTCYSGCVHAVTITARGIASKDFSR